MAGYNNLHNLKLYISQVLHLNNCDIQCRWLKGVGWLVNKMQWHCLLNLPMSVRYVCSVTFDSLDLTQGSYGPFFFSR